MNERKKRDERKKKERKEVAHDVDENRRKKV
jgi:hypothetical protein